MPVRSRGDPALATDSSAGDRVSRQRSASEAKPQALAEGVSRSEALPEGYIALQGRGKLR